MSFGDLNNTVLWISHILIGHDASKPNFLNAIRPFEWLDGAPPSRSRAEAQRLAHEISLGLARQPTSFSELARAHSDDLGSRMRGGSLGGVRASQLGPSFLDAIQATRRGSATRAFETSQGFHILLQSDPPPEERISGQRIVIRYKGDLQTSLRGEASRSLEDAFEIARSLTQSDDTFTELVRVHSESADRVRDGDLGVWSTTAPEHNGIILEELGRLELDAISHPVLTPDGVHLLKRVAVTEREALSASVVRFPYDPAADLRQPSSRAAVHAIASAAAPDLSSNPEVFSAKQAECCPEILHWRRGVGEPLLEHAVMGLTIDEIYSHPVDLGWCFAIPRRLAPTQISSNDLAYELASPKEIALDNYLLHSDGATLADKLSRMRADAARTLGFDVAEQSIVDGVLSDLETKLRAARDGHQRVRENQHALRELNARLSPEVLNRFHSFVRAWLINEVMENHAPVGNPSGQ